MLEQARERQAGPCIALSGVFDRVSGVTIDPCQAPAPGQTRPAPVNGANDRPTATMAASRPWRRAKAMT
jgi:hypothetical protein